MVAQRGECLVYPPLPQLRREVVVPSLRQRGGQAWRQGVRLLFRELGPPPVQEPPEPAHHGTVGIAAPRLELQHSAEVSQSLRECWGAFQGHGPPLWAFVALSHSGRAPFQEESGCVGRNDACLDLCSTLVLV